MPDTIGIGREERTFPGHFKGIPSQPLPSDDLAGEFPGLFSPSHLGRGLLHTGNSYSGYRHLPPDFCSPISTGGFAGRALEWATEYVRSSGGKEDTVQPSSSIGLSAMYLLPIENAERALKATK